jgi:hypothetical protein
MTVQRTENKRQLRPCVKCSKLFIGVVDDLCLKCEKNDKYYKKTRQKGEPREFLDYPELLEKWRARRRECIIWRREAMKYSHVESLKRAFEAEKSILLMVITATSANLDIAEELGKQIEELKQQNERLEARVRYAEQRSYTPHIQYRYTDNITIPHDQWRRLVQLTHPDKHGNSRASTEVMQWLLQNKPSN